MMMILMMMMTTMMTMMIYFCLMGIIYTGELGGGVSATDRYHRTIPEIKIIMLMMMMMVMVIMMTMILVVCLHLHVHHIMSMMIVFTMMIPQRQIAVYWKDEDGFSGWFDCSGYCALYVQTPENWTNSISHFMYCVQKHYTHFIHICSVHIVHCMYTVNFTVHTVTWFNGFLCVDKCFL